MADDLLTLLREHDLPPFWDGLAVVWDTPGAPSPPQCSCARRRNVPRPATAVAPQPWHQTKGRVARAAFIDHNRIAYEDDNRARLGGARGLRESVALYRLYAWRCPDCLLDVVWDTDTTEWFDLDHTDYGPDGSRAP